MKRYKIVQLFNNLRKSHINDMTETNTQQSLFAQELSTQYHRLRPIDL